MKSKPANFSAKVVAFFGKIENKTPNLFMVFFGARTPTGGAFIASKGIKHSQQSHAQRKLVHAK